MRDLLPIYKMNLLNMNLKIIIKSLSRSAITLKKKFWMPIQNYSYRNLRDYLTNFLKQFCAALSYGCL